MQKLRRPLAMLLCVLMLVACIPQMAFAAPESAPTIFLIGDSTVNIRQDNLIGWGNQFAQYFNTEINNQAIAGRGAKQYIAEGRLDTVVGLISEGDIVLIQWGHNDANHEREARYAPPGDMNTEGTYQYYIKQHVDRVREAGGIPILVTVPATHNNGLNYDGEIGTFYDEETGMFLESFPKYANGTREVARALNVPLIDLNILSMDFFNSLPNKAEGYLSTDGVHFVEAGANAIAQIIVKDMLRQKTPGYEYVKDLVVGGTYRFNMEGPAENGFVSVGIEDTYNSYTGYGWVKNGVYDTLAVVDQSDVQADPLKSHYVKGETLKIGEDNDETGAHATYVSPTFGVYLEAGVYDVKLTIGRESAAYVSGARIEEVLKAVPYYTGGLPNNTSVVPPSQYITTPAGTYKETTFRVAVWDGQLTIELTGVDPMLCAVEITPCDGAGAAQTPTVHLAGDSTVAKYDDNQVGYGVNVPFYFDGGVVVNNAAVGGLAAKTYINDGYFNNLLQSMKPGDYLFVDWGHNDSTPSRPNRYLEPEEFKVYLEKYIDAANAFGVTPVFVTPINQVRFDENGIVYNSFQRWTDAQIEVAAANSVYLADLNAASKAHFQEIGYAETLKLFKTNDTTHINNEGAHFAAEVIADFIAASDLPLAEHAYRKDVDRDSYRIAMAKTQVKTPEKYGNFATLEALLQELGDTVKANSPQSVYDEATQRLETTMDALDLLPDDSGYDTPARQMERLGRGLVAVHVPGEGVFVSWRYLGTDDPAVAFNVYRNGYLVSTGGPVTGSTNFLDAGGSDSSLYSISMILDGVETIEPDVVSPLMDNYLNVKLNKPEGGVTPSGGEYTYRASDASVADVDGDGEYEVIVKWDPTNSQDNANSGYTGNVYLDCYKLTGKQLWRIDLGVNIRAGAHYTQFLVYDFDGDGKAELVCKTADGTVDGAGITIGDPTADYRNSGGYILSGPEFLTVFNGQTGAAVDTVNYDPPRSIVSNWGDTYGNRQDRFLATVAYLDGVRPSIVMTRGYYTQTFIVGFDYVDGSLVKRGHFYSTEQQNASDYEYQGNHSVSATDVDGDGRDEIVFGAMVIDDDFTPLHTTKLGHGDAQHTGDLDPTRDGLEILSVHESTSAQYGMEMRDASTGTILWGWKDGNIDVGRGMSANIDPRYAGSESWANTVVNSSEFRPLSPLYDAKGNVILDKLRAPEAPCNFTIWWDGDLTRELLDSEFDYGAAKVGTPAIYKWDWKNRKLNTLLLMSGTQTNNSTKANVMLQADVFGDWREEVIARTEDSTAMRIYTTTDITETRLYTLMHNPTYRLGVAWQNVAYNQPPHTDYYIGDGMEIPKQPNIYLAGESQGISGVHSFNFGSAESVVDGYTTITPDSNYTTELGYGFGGATSKEGIDGDGVEGSYIKFNEKTRDTSRKFYNADISRYDTFLVDLPNGDYRVTALIGQNTGIIAELNRKIYPGDARSISFDVAVVDGQLTLEIYNDDGGLDPTVYALTVDRLPERTAAQYPTLYLAGDSTVQTYNPNGTQYPMAGWGQMLGSFFSGDVSVANRSIGGRSTKSFIADGFFDSIMRDVRPGDYVFVQFGHNDASAGIAYRYVTPEEYKSYLRLYVDGARQRGAIPVIVTLVNRYDVNSSGVFNISFPDYVNAAKEVAEETGAAMIDLNAMSRAFFEEYGAENARVDFYMHLQAGVYPNYPNGASDSTHFQWAGAIEVARLVKDGIEETIPALREFLTDPADLYPPTTPEALRVVSAENGRITLAWGRVDNATDYEIYMRAVSEPESAFALVDSTKYANMTIDVPLEHRNYYVKVRAVNERGASEFSERLLVEHRVVANKVYENYEDKAQSELAWTLKGGNTVSTSYTGDLAESIKAFGERSAVGNYTGGGGGPRGLQLNMKSIVEDEKNVTVNFDWYPGTPGSNFVKFAVQDGTTASFSRNSYTMDNQFVNFFVRNNGTIYYYLNNIADDNESVPSGAVQLTGINGTNMWFNVNLFIDFETSTLSFSFTDEEGTVLDSRENLPFAEGIEYNRQVGSLRFMGWKNGNNGVNMYLDNVSIAPSAKDEPPVEGDKSALRDAVAQAEGLNPSDYIDFSAIPPLLEWAYDVLDDVTAPQDTIDALTEQLLAAIDALEIYVPVVFEDFEDGTASDSWTVVKGNGTSYSGTGGMDETVVPFGPGGSAGKYTGSGSGPRGIQLNFNDAIAYDKVIVKTDWYPSQPANTSRHAKFAIQDGASFRASGALDNQFINFITTGGRIYYYIGNFEDDVAIPDGAVQIPGIASTNAWYHIEAVMDFTASKLSFTFSDLDGNVLVTVEGADFAEGVAYNPQVASLRFMTQRPDGGGYSAYLDNVEAAEYKGGEEPMPADKAALIAAIEQTQALNPDDYIDFSGVAEALAAAIAVRDSNEATQDEVDAATAALLAAIGALEPKPGFLALDVSLGGIGSLVEGLSAYLTVTVSADEPIDDLQLTAYLLVNGEELYPTELVYGTGRMYIPAAPAAGSYQVIVKGEGAEGSAPITVLAYNPNIWTVSPGENPDGVFLRLFARATVGSALVNNKAVSFTLEYETVSGGANTLVKFGQLTPGAYSFELRKVKLTELFPSYTFTYKATYNVQ